MFIQYNEMDHTEYRATPKHIANRISSSGTLLEVCFFREAVMATAKPTELIVVEPTDPQMID
jgi:hypothetical protein